MIAALLIGWVAVLFLSYRGVIMSLEKIDEI